MRGRLIIGILAAVSRECVRNQRWQPPVASQSPLADSADRLIYGLPYDLNEGGR